jgi:hypothetical protein
MDIEGGEADFFESNAFKAWLTGNRIIWLVEVHTAKLGFTPAWDDVPRYELDPGHVLYDVDESRLNRFVSSLKQAAE